jgi:hypothetical protein
MSKIYLLFLISPITHVNGLRIRKHEILKRFKLKFLQRFNV